MTEKKSLDSNSASAAAAPLGAPNPEVNIPPDQSPPPSEPGPFQQLQDCLAAIRAGTATAETYLARGQAYQQLGSLDAAIEDYSRVFGFKPRPDTPVLAEACAARCDCYRLLDKSAEAIADGEKAVRLASGEARYWLALGHARYGAEDHVAALADLEEALRLDPALWHAYAIRGRVHRAIGDTWRAVSDYTRAIDGSLEAPAEYFLWRAGAYIILGDYVEAEKDCTTGIALDSSHWRLWLQRGHSRFHGRGDLEGALADLTQAIGLVPNADAFLERGLVYRALGADNAAGIDFNQFVARHPSGSQVGLKELAALINTAPASSIEKPE